MSNHDDEERSVVSSKAVDVAVAAILFAFGALVSFDSSRIGAKWAEDGPQSGYFPFYIGVIICISSWSISSSPCASSTTTADRLCRLIN